MSTITTDRVLWAAWSRVAAGSGMPGVDGVTPERYAAKVGENLSGLGDLLRSGRYRPQPLRPLVVKRGKKDRHLGVPTVRDRVAQRAFLESTRRQLDSAAADASFAYRRGRSWLDALGKVERCRDQGLRWVFRGDIQQFFDRIDHGILRESISSLLGEPAAVDLAMGWVAAPVLGENGLVERDAGVPQGAPISAALANHYLTPLDRAVDGGAGQLVRYADDLCVCCADEDSASQSSWLVDCALGKVRLRMNPEKSYVSSFDRGFSFLGWVFFRHDGWEEDPSGRWIHPMSVGRSRSGPGRPGLRGQ
ncbi:MAG: reverse transcriptase domain-containing protein [Acidimicrobiales bacterium]